MRLEQSYSRKVYKRLIIQSVTFLRNLTNISATTPHVQREKEALALILAIQHFDFYLSGAIFPIEVFADHNPLVFLNKMRDKNQRLLRWSLMLQEYIKVSHIRGTENVMADAL